MVKLSLKIILEIMLCTIWESLQILLPGAGTVVAFCGRILALGRWNLQMSVQMPEPPGWPLISASLSKIIPDKAECFPELVFPD